MSALILQLAPTNLESYNLDNFRLYLKESELQDYTLIKYHILESEGDLSNMSTIRWSLTIEGKVNLQTWYGLLNKLSFFGLHYTTYKRF